MNSGYEKEKSLILRIQGIIISHHGKHGIWYCISFISIKYFVVKNSIIAVCHILLTKYNENLKQKTGFIDVIYQVMSILFIY